VYFCVVVADLTSTTSTQCSWNHWLLSTRAKASLRCQHRCVHTLSKCKCDSC